MALPDVTTTVVEACDIPLDGPIYEDTENGKMSFEVRDFGTPNRNLVVRFWLDGQVYTAMASWEKFTDEFDGMRSRMLPSDWDSALSSLIGGNTP